MNRKMAVLLLPVAGVLIAAGVARMGEKGQWYKADLQPLNNSGVSGTAWAHLEGNKLTVEVKAKGLTPNEPHPMHIHGFSQPGKASTCPSDRENVTLKDSVGKLGSPIQSLEPFDRVSSSGELKFKETYTVNAQQLQPLDERAIVIHGMQMHGSYDDSAPVACGRFEKAEHGRMPW